MSLLPKIHSRKLRPTSPFLQRGNSISTCEAALILYISEGVKVSIWCTEICLQDYFLPQGVSEEMG